MNTNFYEEKLKEVDLLIKDSKLIEATSVLKEELSMPYVPEKYEKQFRKILDETMFALLSDNQSHKSINIEELLTMLNKDEESQSIALELLKNHNLRPVASTLKARIESWTKEDGLKRAFLFELLADQEINININIDGVNVNPQKDSILNNSEVIKGLKNIPVLVEKTPQLLEPTINEFRRYLLLNFPNQIINGEELSVNIFNIIKHLLNNEFSLSEKEMKILKILNG